MKSADSNLDFLRAVAVLLVVAGHTLHFFGVDQLGPLKLVQLGGLGVEIFFVHTALVLMMSLERQAAGQPAKLFSSFMIRRCFRIYPLAMVAIATVAILGIPQGDIGVGHFGGLRFDGMDLFSNLFLVQSFSMRSPILGPTWSLAYELQMYLFLPGIFLLLSRGNGSRRASILWIASIAGSLVAVGLFGSSGNLAAFVPCFIPGVIAYQLGKRSTWTAPAWQWIVAVALLVASYLAGPGDGFAKSWLTCSLLGLAIPAFSQLRSRWIVEPSKAIAKYSYGIYLAHFAIIWFAFERLGSLPAAAKWIVFLVLLAAIPVALFHAIENPMIRIGRKASDMYADSKTKLPESFEVSPGAQSLRLV